MYPKKSAKYVIKNKCKIYYWHHKTPKAKDTIVFFNASSVNHTGLLNLEKLLRHDGYSTITFDQRGTGYSSKPRQMYKYTVTKFASDLAEILKKEKIKNPIFITHSYGMMPTVQYVSETNNAKKIISFAGTYNMSETTVTKVAYYSFQFLLRHRSLVTATFNHIKELLFRRKIRYMNFAKIKQKNELAVNGIFEESSSEIFVHANRSMAYENLHLDISDELENLKVPLVNFIGDSDIMVTRKANKGLEKRVKKFKGINIKGGHSVPTLSPMYAFKLVKEELEPSSENKKTKSSKEISNKKTKKNTIATKKK